MKKETWLFLGQDPRLRKSSELIVSPERQVVFSETADWTEGTEELCRTVQPDCIVFPIQPLNVKKEIDRSCFPENTVLFFGRATEEWNALSKHFSTYFYLKEEQFIWQNAKLTAEGWVAAFYEKNRKSINGKTFHITGFGRVAKMLASMLKSMGASVFIFVRSEKDVCEAKAYGYDASYLTPSTFQREPIRWLVNTIPASWFTAEYSTTANKDLFLFDLASAPGCLNGVNLGERYELLPGIPGKYFAEDAAFLLSETVIQLYNLEKEHSNA